MQIACDVLVVGAGPAGASAAREAAKMGVKVILIDTRKEVGLPVQCAEYIPWQMGLGLPKGIICQRVSSMRTHINGEVTETEARGFIIHRGLFDQYLSNEAVKQGAELLLKTKAIRLEDGLVIARNIQIKTKVIIGADGPHSTVGKWMGSVNTEFVQTAQYKMPLCNRLHSTEVYFQRDIPGGYGWVFPKGDVANVGVGVSKRNALKVLDRFVNHLKESRVIKPDILNRTGGAIPVGGLVKRLSLANILLVGDAGGMAHPVNGAGVSNAVMCGKIAGKISAKAVLAKDFKILLEYEDECKILLLDTLKRAVQKREAMERYWNEGDKDAIKENWIT